MGRKSTPDKLLGEWFWTDRWMGSSGFLLPLEARGLYREMLTQAWRRGARLPNDHETIQRAVGCTAAEWKRCWPRVERYWRIDGDGLVNDTQLEVYAQCRAEHDAASNRGKKGAQARAQARAQACAQVTTQAPTQVALEHPLEDKPPDPDPEELSEEQESSRRARANGAVFEGASLRVSRAQHDLVLREMGSHAAHLDFQRLYASWDAQLQASGEHFDTLVFIKRRAAETLRSMRACGLARRDDAAVAQRDARQLAEERRRADEAAQVDALWSLLPESERSELRRLAALEIRAFTARMRDEARLSATEAAARRLLGDRFPGVERKRAELARLREGTVVA
jgi:uncharacterized protein YdaU (DUF1376 family)